ncbi:MAG TPA: hypothetical protein VKV38_01570 [Trebonia sp.]|nr:hypothetical protein [Trebonia sp.]
MRVTFPRPRDHEIAYAVVERDDGVVYRLHGGRAGTALPHDIRHLIVERELGVTDGIWGGIAAGTVFTGVRHVRGRRPPYPAGRPASLRRSCRHRLLRAGLLADLVETVAALDAPSPDEIRRLTKIKLAGAPGAAPPPEAIAAAARALQVEAARWARLRPGEELRYEWPLEPPPRVPPPLVPPPLGPPPLGPPPLEPPPRVPRPRALSGCARPAGATS